MERRPIFALLVGPPITLGGAAVLASLSYPTYAEMLRLVGVGGIAVGFGVWLGLLLTAGPAKTPDQRKYISLTDAGAWLYARAPPTVREAIASWHTSVYASVDDAAAGYVKEAVARGAAVLYGRRGAGLPMEALGAGDAMEFTAFDALFGSDKPQMFDLSVRRRDLRKVLKFYKSSER